MNPQFLAAMIVSRSAFEALDGHMRNLDPLNQAIVGAIEQYYKRDSHAQYVDIDILEQQICIQLSNPKHKSEVSAILTLVRDLAPNVSEVNVREVAQMWKRASLGRDIATMLASGKLDGVSPLMEDWLSTMDNVEQEREPELSEILEHLVNPANALPIGPKVFNDMLDGGAHPENHVCIFGRSNAGKSLVAIDTCARLARLGRKGIYFENEDNTNSTRLRFYTNLSGMTKHEMAGSGAAIARKRAYDNGYDNIKIVPATPGSIGEIRQWVRKSKPDYIVVNQVRNLAIGGVSNMTEKLERAAIGMRNVCKKEGILAISITQAGDSASNKLVLDQSDIDSSKTGLIGQVDLLMGVGVNQDYEEQNIRVLSTPKNKLGANSGHCAVRINKFLSKIMDE